MKPLARLSHARASVSGRVALGLLSNLIGKFWIVAIQLVSVPVLLSRWGPTGYGVWLMITTIPTYIGLSSAGFGTAAAIDMTQKFANGDREGVLSAFHSVWSLLTAILGGVFAACLGMWACRNAIAHLFSLNPIADSLADTGLALVIYSIGSLQMSIVCVGFQSSRRYAQGTFLLDLLMPIEALGVIAACLGGSGILGAAICMAIIRTVGAVLYYLLLLRFESWMTLGWSRASLRDIRRLGRPAIASLSMMLSAALSLQGLILTLGIFASPAVTAVFATARLLTRTPLQFIGLINRATLPEMTAAYAKGDRPLSAKLIALNFIVTGIVAIPSAIVMIAIGPLATSALSKGHLHATTQLFVWLALTAAFQGLWNTIGQFLYAINKQQTFAYHYVVLAALIAAAPIFTGRHDQVERVAMLWCLAEGIMIFVVLRAWIRESEVRLADFRHVTDFISGILRSRFHVLRTRKAVHKDEAASGNSP